MYSAQGATAATVTQVLKQRLNAIIAAQDDDTHERHFGLNRLRAARDEVANSSALTPVTASSDDTYMTDVMLYPHDGQGNGGPELVTSRAPRPSEL